jgi:predicted PurR-regulated permease PerM
MSKLVALLFTIWMIPATLIDNFLKPILMARGLPIPMLVIFIGVFGGTLTHGIIGLFIGPVILALGYELIRAWINDDLKAIPIEAEGEK